MSEIIHIGILGAMPQEIGQAKIHLKNIKQTCYGDLKIYSGEIKSIPNQKLKCYVSIAWSGWGKVSAARASTRIISSIYQNKTVDFVIFTGVAGSAEKTLDQWDIVIANKIFQHDMDATPLYPKYVIPAINSRYIEASLNLNNWAEKVISNAIKNKTLKNFKSVCQGIVATGDRFISDKNTLKEISKEISGLKAVEMEGASFAQVATQEGVPWIVVRVISDKADQSASLTFTEFLKIYELNSWNLIETLISELKLDLI